MVIIFLHGLKVEIDYYYKEHKFKPETNYCANYEDLYYMASQIYYSELGHYDNPAVQPLVDKISLYIQPLLEKTNTRYKWTLSELAGETIKYIECVVCLLLTEKRDSLDYLSCIKDACLDSQLPKVDIFTLNHDTVLEEYFKRNNIRFTDGFNKKPEPAIKGFKVRRWNQNLFKKSFKVRLFKLHGSVNWRWFNHKDWENELIGIPLSPDPLSPEPWHIEDSAGQKSKVDSRLIFLVGTYNKMIDYTRGIYQELRFQFYRSLRNVDQLIICGYGFGDEGINTEILEWIYSSPKNGLVIIHPRPEELREKVTFPIERMWGKCKEQKKLEIIPKKFEETSWHDVKDILFKNIQMT